MTNEEAKEILKLDQNAQFPVSLVESYIRCGEEYFTFNEEMKVREAIAVAIKALKQEPSVWDNDGELTEYGEKCRDRIFKQEPCTDAISRQAVLNILDDMVIEYIKENDFDKAQGVAWVKVQQLSSVSTEKTGRCKDCKHFVYDEFAIVNGIPIIVAHEICMRWGNGCKTKEDGYCHMFEPKTQEVEE